MKTKNVVIDVFVSQLYLFIPGVLLLIVEQWFNTLIPLVTGNIVDELTAKPDTLETVKALVIRLALYAVIAFAIKFVWRFLLMGNGRRYEKLIRERVFTKLSRLDSSFCDRTRTGDIITRVISDVSAIRQSLSFGITSIFDIAMSLIMPMYIMISTMNLSLALVSFAAIPPVVVFLIFVRRIIAARFLKIQEANANLSSKIDENLSGIREIKAYGQEGSESERIAELSKARYDAEINQVKVSALLNPVSKIGFAITFTIFIIAGGLLVYRGEMSVGTFITFNTYIGTMTSNMVRISRNVQIWQKGIASMKRLDLIFTAETKINDDKADDSITEIEPSIEIKNLSFGYTEEKRVLTDISLCVKAGGTLGIMGRTGSGKSALLDAISRRYTIPDGTVFIGGHDVNAIPLAVLKKAEGAVVQDGFLFSDTIAGNIDFYSGASDDEIRVAANIADIAGNIEEFPDKYATVVGERGVTLSGGQRQRVSIARAVVKKPKILLLDDCMSAVDTETEKKIIDNLYGMSGEVTKIITAHRVSAIMHADEIIFLENGRIAERGTHEQLMELHGRYYSLYMLQSQEGV